MTFGHAPTRLSPRQERGPEPAGSAWRQLDADRRLALVDDLLGRFGKAA